MYELYITNKNYSSWSLRPWALMEELAIPFAEKLVPFGEAAHDFTSFSPTGKVPAWLMATSPFGNPSPSSSIWRNGTRAFGPMTPKRAHGPDLPQRKCMLGSQRCATSTL